MDRLKPLSLSGHDCEALVKLESFLILKTKTNYCNNKKQKQKNRETNLWVMHWPSLVTSSVVYPTYPLSRVVTSQQTHFCVRLTANSSKQSHTAAPSNTRCHGNTKTTSKITCLQTVFTRVILLLPATHAVMITQKHMTVRSDTTMDFIVTFHYPTQVSPCSTILAYQVFVRRSHCRRYAS